MLKKRICLLALGIATASQAMANDQEAAKGFVEDSHLDLFFRNLERFIDGQDLLNRVDRELGY